MSRVDGSVLPPLPVRDFIQSHRPGIGAADDAE
eukprot:CAMPEP_0184551980 /NCGR_PEP_ID=MMETSP0199_2-20130426/27316_1 /TAXON_ID=1112570 /ORGANISM="Thraustochytrium sp., Strain LLF1b" /LENGTH=32 /DNA_ID= /DNA_START= /DNA_END= /DNA_ORIENTATION=